MLWDKQNFRLTDNEIRDLVLKSADFDFQKVAVVFGGSSEEAEISRKSGKAVLEALIKQNIDAHPFDLSEQPVELLKGFDRVFLCLHGRGGEDGTVQGFCESMGIPYTSEDPVSSAICMHKPTAKSVMRMHGIPTPDWFSFTRENWREFYGRIKDRIKEMLPVVVKPAFSGSSFGVSVVFEKKEVEEAVERAFGFGDEVMVERYVEGVEITVGLLFGKVLGTLEIRPRDDTFFSFHSKYEGKTEYIIPPSCDVEDAESLCFLCARAFRLIWGACRIDIILSDGTPYFLEINTIPGMTPRSLLPKIANWRGMSFEELVRVILWKAKAGKVMER